MKSVLVYIARNEWNFWKLNLQRKGENCRIGFQEFNWSSIHGLRIIPMSRGSFCRYLILWTEHHKMWSCSTHHHNKHSFPQRWTRLVRQCGPHQVPARPQRAPQERGHGSYQGADWGGVLSAGAWERDRRGWVSQDHDKGQVSPHRQVCLWLRHQARPQEGDGRAQGQHHEAGWWLVPEAVWGGECLFVLCFTQHSCFVSWLILWCQSYGKLSLVNPIQWERFCS